jgi:uncharacterized protein (TIRG00374 family)
MNNKNSRIAVWGTVAAIAAILILFAVFVDWRTVANQLRRSDWRYLIAASIALLIGLALYAARWRALLTTKLRWRSTFHAANVGHAVNTLIPMRAGEPARIVMLGRSESASIAEVTSSVVVERLFEQIMRLTALVSAVAVGAGLTVSPGTIVGALAFVSLALGGMIWLIRNRENVLARWPVALARIPRVTESGARQLLASILAGLAGVASPRQLIVGLTWSLLTWACFAIFHALALLALQLNLPTPQLVSMSLGALALAPPSAPTQPGVYHASVVVPLTAIGFDNATLTAYAVILHALQMAWMVGLGLWAVWHSGASAKELFQKA